MPNDNILKINDYRLKETIADLRLEADEIKNLQNENRKRRPIVVEFSGSPRSGKTTCINSLVQFFKKNEYKVYVIQESVSICPVSDKHSPFFDYWILCNMLTELIGILGNENNDFDVVIIDRGIFDSLCWFNWLCAQGKLEEEMKKNTEKFLLSNEFIKYIDIVFSFRVKPEISMQREYATLLTDVSGTIMNIETLQQYIDAIKLTIELDGKYLHKLHVIDTSDSDQNIITKEVTKKTLDTIRVLWKNI